VNATTNERTSQTFPPDATAVRAARRFAVDAAGASGPDGDALELAVSELASNAVLHARTPFVVTVERLADGVRVSVTDADPSMRPVPDPDAAAITGRGLAIVRSLSRRFQVDLSPGGKTVSFELSWATP
jgi:anti-sigma regulatory factor (Ser/Thr protein kinase)